MADGAVVHSPATLKPENSSVSKAPESKPESYVARLQRTLGNRAFRDIVQTRLIVGPAGDRYELEAERVAEQVMGMHPGQEPTAAAADPRVQRACRSCGEKPTEDQTQIRRLCAHCEQEEEKARRSPEHPAKPVAAAPTGRPATIAEGDLRSGGDPMPDPVRHFFESRFSRNFTDVRVHTGQVSETYNDTLHSYGFTYGNHIWLGRGQQPVPSLLMAHELAHVVQQHRPPHLRGGRAFGQGLHQDREPVVRRWEPYSPRVERGSPLQAEFIPERAGLKLVHSPAPTAGLKKPLVPYSPGPFNVRRLPVSTNLNLSIVAPVAIQRRVFDPTTQAPVNNLNNIELAEAIEDTERLLEFRFLGYEVISPSAQNTVGLNLKLLVAERQARNASKPLLEGKKEAWNEGEQIAKPGIVQEDGGAWLYSNRTSVPIRRMRLNEVVAVERKLQGGWYLIVTRRGEPGYVIANAINTSMPDPEARLYRVQTGDTAIGIAEKFYTDFKYGQDKRYFINVLVLVNHEAHRPGIKNKTLDTSGEGQADVDWEASAVFAGMQIWVPGQRYAVALRGKIPTGSISYDAYTKLAGFLSDVGEFLLGSLAFVAGLLHGALESLWDLVVGLVDLGKMVFSFVKSIILGEIGDQMSKLWDTIKNIKLSEVFDAVSEWLDKKWNAPGTWDRWQFRGWLIGYIIMEIVLLVASDGLISGLKWIGKAAKIEKLVAKLPFLAKVVEAAKDLKKAGKLKEVLEGVKVVESLVKARKWAQEVLAIPSEILELLTEAAIAELKKLPSWAVERFRELNAAAMKILLGCASPCKVDVAKIIEHLAGLAEKGYAGARKLLDKGDVLKALSTLSRKMNTSKIAEYLERYPALMKVIKKAELTDADLLKLGEFLTGADATNPETAYKTFIRYLTNVVPAKTGNDIGKFNTIMQDMLEVDKAVAGAGDLSEAERAAQVAQLRQGSALKGSMFEAFARMHLPEFQAKILKRVRFVSQGALELSAESRTGDFFIEASGELWDFKSSLKIDAQQAEDYIKILNHAEAGLPRVTSINYLFPSRELAEANRKIKDLGVLVHYISSAGKVVIL